MCTDEQTDRKMDERTYLLADIQTYGQTQEWMDGQLDKGTDRY